MKLMIKLQLQDGLANNHTSTKTESGFSVGVTADIWRVWH